MNGLYEASQTRTHMDWEGESAEDEATNSHRSLACVTHVAAGKTHHLRQA